MQTVIIPSMSINYSLWNSGHFPFEQIQRERRVINSRHRILVERLNQSKLPLVQFEIPENPFLNYIHFHLTFDGKP